MNNLFLRKSKNARRRSEREGFSCTCSSRGASPTRSMPNSRPTWPNGKWRSRSSNSRLCARDFR